MAGKETAEVQLAPQRHERAKNQADRIQEQMQRGNTRPMLLQPMHFGYFV